MSETVSDSCSPEIRLRLASDGYPLHYRHWNASLNSPRGWLLVLHGIQSHSGWYESSGSCFARAGWNVRMPDRRGSGLNRIRRGDVCHSQRLLRDVRHFLFDIHQERRRCASPGPVLIAGISWGGKLALQLARDASSQIDGLTLITPGLFPYIRPGLLDRWRLNAARWAGITQRQIPIPLDDPACFTSVPAQQEFIRHDPLALHTVTLGFLHANRDLDRLVQRPGQIPVPTQLMLADDDRIIDNQRTESFLRSKAGRGLDLCTYPAAAHTLELEHCRDEFLRDWLNWAGQIRSTAAATPGVSLHSTPPSS